MGLWYDKPPKISNFKHYCYCNVLKTINFKLVCITQITSSVTHGRSNMLDYIRPTQWPFLVSKILFLVNPRKPCVKLYIIWGIKTKLMLQKILLSKYMTTFLPLVKFSSRKCEGANGNKAWLFTKTEKGLMSVCQYTTSLIYFDG